MLATAPNLSIERTIELPESVVKKGRRSEPISNGGSADSRRFLERVNSLVERCVTGGRQPVILTSARVRGAVRRLIEPILPHVAVISFAEVTSGTPVTTIGTVEWSDE